MRLTTLHLIASCAAVVTLSCHESRTLPACTEPAPSTGPTIESGGDPVILAAGDIAYRSDLSGAQATASLLDKLNGTVLTLGDNAYDHGSIDDYLDLYAPTWGRHRWRTRPAPGNHEYETPHAGGYFGYFCTSAGDPEKGYYSYDIGKWHLVVINSECGELRDDSPSCAAGSDQERWLRADLAAHAAKCTLAYWHHPRFSSGSHGDNPAMQDIWQALYDAHADVVLNGHVHTYERFAPQTPTSVADPTSGIREFVVGTGGADLTSFNAPHPNSEVRHSGTWGVLKMTLHDASYDWEFVSVDGSFSDTGTEACR